MNSLRYSHCARPVILGVVAIALLASRHAPAAVSKPSTTVKAWPLVYYSADAEADTKRLELLWPFIEFRRSPDKDPLKLLRLLSVHTSPISEEARVAGLFSLMGAVAGEPERWRVWMAPLLWTGATPKASHLVLFPIYWQFKSERQSKHTVFPLYFFNQSPTERVRAVFPLFYFGESETTRSQSKTAGYLFLVWKGWREWTRENETVKRRSEHLNVFPFFWNRVVFKGADRVSHSTGLLPLLTVKSRDEVTEYSRSITNNWSTLVIAGKSHSEYESRKNGSTRVTDTFRVWPFFRDYRYVRTQPQEDTASTNTALSFFPLFKMSNGLNVNKDGELSDRHSGRLFPLLFWGKKEYDGELKERHFVQFPLYWDLEDKDSSVRAVVPLGAKFKGPGYESTNILGPLFTMIRNDKEGSVRYDALFPLAMLKRGADELSARVFPLFSVLNEDDERRMTSFLWPFYRSDESVGKANNSILGAIFGGMSDVFEWSGKRPSGELKRELFPFMFHERRSDSRSMALIPFYGSSKRRSGAGDKQTWWAGAGILANHSERTDPVQSDTKVLLGAGHFESGETENGWFVFPFGGDMTAARYSATARTTQETRDRWALPPVYKSTKSITRSAIDGARTRESFEHAIPLFFSDRQSNDLDNDRLSRTTRLLCIDEFGVFNYNRRGDDRSWSFLNPVYTRSLSSDGQRVSKSFGGLVNHAEKDINGFTSQRVLYRVFRREENSRRSSWELMPLADGEKTIDGERSFNILGGLLGYEKLLDRTRLRFLFLPLSFGKRDTPTMSEEEARERAGQHLEYGLRYLKGWSYKDALVELALAQPAFNDDPTLYESLGDAYAGVRTTAAKSDLLEETMEEISRFTSNYPRKFQVDLAGNFGWGEFYRDKARESFDRAKELGGDSPMLRRKRIRLERDRGWLRDAVAHGEILRMYREAVAAYPDDFSLALDHAGFLLERRDAREQGLNRLRQIVVKWPDSATARHRLATERNRNRKYNDYETQAEALEIALAGARLPGDEPAYLALPSRSGATDREQDERPHCLALAASILKAQADRHFQQKKYYDSLDKIDMLLALERELGSSLDAIDSRNRVAPSSFLSKIGAIHRNSGRAEALLPYLREKTDELVIDGEREIWRREIRRLEREASYLTAWAVNGPLLSETWKTIGLGKATWREISNPLFETHVDLREVFGSGLRAEAVCSTTINSPSEMDARLLLGFDERATVWLNGERVFGPNREKIASLDEHKAPIHLRKGANELMIRVENRRLSWGFYARIADRDGRPVKGLTTTPIQAIPDEE